MVAIPSPAPALPAEVTTGPAGAAAARRAARDAVERYLAAIREGRRGDAVAVASGLMDDGVPAEVVISDLLASAQSEVGRAWQEGRWSIAMEHRATAIAESALETVVARTILDGTAAAAPSWGPVAVFCVEDEWHTLPARMLTEILRLRGAEVAFVGPSMPAEEVAGFLGPSEGTAAAVACSLPLNLVGAWRLINEMRRLGVPTVCGGRGFGSHGQWATAVGADTWSPTFVAGADALRAALDGPPLATRPPTGSAAVRAEVQLARRDGAEWVETATQAVRRGWPGMRDDVRAVRATRDDLGSTLRVLTAGVLVSDTELVTDFVTWFEQVVASRGLPLAFVSAAFGLLLDVLPAEAPLLRGMATTGLQACTQPFA